jgi:hypothetical protein
MPRPANKKHQIGFYRSVADKNPILKKAIPRNMKIKRPGADIQICNEITHVSVTYEIYRVRHSSRGGFRFVFLLI